MNRDEAVEALAQLAAELRECDVAPFPHSLSEYYVVLVDEGLRSRILAALTASEPFFAQARVDAIEEAAKVLDQWISNTGEMLLSCGEMSAQEIRTVKAVLRQRARAIRSLSHVSTDGEGDG